MNGNRIFVINVNSSPKMVILEYLQVLAVCLHESYEMRDFFFSALLLALSKLASEMSTPKTSFFNSKAKKITNFPSPQSTSRMGAAGESQSV